MIKKTDTESQRISVTQRVRGKISGTPPRPRLNVFRSESNIYARSSTMSTASPSALLPPWKRSLRATAATAKLPRRSAR